ncbi:MAG: hypothetical protein Ct9H300mP1_38280 [Planctomycetaceae bacterium]|nr:MAG: hypothetical protein Ct9H300mP1_38280 [Planctomycetaceae bacterium]
MCMVFCHPMGAGFPDRMITAIDFRPGNSRVVHHASFRYDDTGGHAAGATDPAPGYRRHGGWGFSSGGTLGGWAAGIQPQRLAPAWAVR